LWSVAVGTAVVGGTKLIPEAIASELLAKAPPHHLKAGESLFEAGDEGDGCYWLDKGVLKVCLRSPQGGERIIAVLSKGSVVGDLAIIDGLPRSASVTALTDCKLRFISRASFQHCAQQYPEIHRYLVALLAQRLRETDESIAALAFLTAKGRVAYALLEIAESLGEQEGSNEIVIPHMINQKDLAALAGVSRENANRILKTWQQRNILNVSSHSYRIKDKAKLEGEMDWV
jgi:CRP/FNR family transcriptional regulator, cyclic AMP receptor protein